MKNCKAIAFLAMGILSTLTIQGTMNPGKVLADNAKCTNATLKGSYAFTLNGFAGDQPPFIPVSALRLAKFDGQGNFTASGFSSSAGSIEQRSFEGTYEVEGDCSVSYQYSVFNLDGSLDSKITLFGVVVNEGNKVLLLLSGDTGRAVTLSGVFEKVK